MAPFGAIFYASIPSYGSIIETVWQHCPRTTDAIIHV